MAASTPYGNDAFISYAFDVPLPQRVLGDVRDISNNEQDLEGKL